MKMRWEGCRNLCAGFALFGLTLLLAAHSGAQSKPKAKAAPVKASANASIISALNAKDAHVVPMIFDRAHGSTPIVPLSINGSKPLYFALDSGTSNYLYLEPWAAKELALTQTPIDAGGEFPGQTVYAAPLESVRLLGGSNRPVFDTKCKYAIVVDMHAFGFVSEAPQIAGILGNEFLADVTVQFDFQAKVLRVYSKAHAPLRPVKNATVVPLTPLAGFPTFRQVQIQLMGAGSVSLILGTGDADALTLNAKTTADAKDILISRALESIVGAGGKKEVIIPVLFSEIGVGKWKEPNVIASISRTERQQRLGIGFLSRFLTTLDFRNNEMILERTADYADLAALKSDAGVVVVLLDNEIIAGQVSADTQAFEQGIRPRDRILAVDNVPVKGETVDAVQKRIDGPSGTKVTLRLQRENNPPFEVTVPRISSFESPDQPMSRGFDVGVDAEGVIIKTLTISDILPNSPAERAGLQAGDVIIGVNKLTVKGETIERVSKEISAPDAQEVTFTVRRKGSDTPLTVIVKTGKTTLRDLLRP